MKVCLLEKIREIGGPGDIVNVANGYGRNYLIPKGKAVLADKEGIKQSLLKRAELEKENLVFIKNLEEKAQKLFNQEITISSKVHDNNKLFGSVGPKEICEAIKKTTNINVEKKEILRNGNIYELGEYSVDVVFRRGISTTVLIKILSE